jgi:FKBP-type peptidyl-prolyl cis-trans isomerase
VSAKIFRVLLVTVVLAGAPACGDSGAMPDSGITSLQTTDVKTGTGDEARPGRTVSVHYTGWLYDPRTADHKGPRFDSSRDSGEPFVFSLGAGEVIPGWDQGVAGMKVGGVRMLAVPPAMGYGSQDAGDGAIPPNSTLLFEVELVAVR